MTVATPHELQALVAAAAAGDERAFGQLTGTHRRELLVHCYRLLGSLDAGMAGQRCTRPP